MPLYVFVLVFVHFYLCTYVFVSYLYLYHSFMSVCSCITFVSVHMCAHVDLHAGLLFLLQITLLTMSSKNHPHPYSLSLIHFSAQWSHWNVGAFRCGARKHQQGLPRDGDIRVHHPCKPGEHFSPSLPTLGIHHSINIKTLVCVSRHGSVISICGLFSNSSGLVVQPQALI